MTLINPVKVGQIWKFCINNFGATPDWKRTYLVKINKIDSLCHGVVVSKNTVDYYKVGEALNFNLDINTKPNWQLVTDRDGQCCELCNMFHNEGINISVKAGFVYPKFLCWNCELGMLYG